MIRIRFFAALALVTLALGPLAERTTAQSSGKTYYVAQTSTASDSNPGTAIAPLRTINAAVSRAVAGDTITVLSGTYAEAVNIAGNSGTATQPITLSASGAVTIQPTSGKPLRIARNYWIVSGFTINAGGHSSPAASFETPANHSILRNSHLLNGSYHGVLMRDGTSDNQVLNSEIHHFGLASSSSDAHGVAIHESHNNLIKDNHIHHNTGDSVQVFTIDTQSLYPRGANNNKIVGNTMHDDRENAVDIKSSRGTVVQNNIMYGYQSSGSSDGMAILVHYNAQDALIANNEIYNSNWGIEVSRGTKNGTNYPAAPQNITIRNNYIHNLVKLNTGNTGDGAGIVVRETNNVSVWNNTVRDAAGLCLVVTWPSTARPSNVQFQNNSTGGCGDGDLFLKDTSPTGLVIDYNGYDQLNGGRLKRGSTTYTLANWKSTFGYDQHSLLAPPTLLANAQLPLGSPLINRGTNVGLTFCGTAPDMGAFESGCSIMTVTSTRTATRPPATSTRTATRPPATATRTATRPPATATIAQLARAATTPTATQAPATATSTATQAPATTTNTATHTATGTATTTVTASGTAVAFTHTPSATPSATPSGTAVVLTHTPSAIPPAIPSSVAGGTRYYTLDGNVPDNYIEAELFTSQIGNFATLSDETRSNGQYIHTPDGSGNDPLTNFMTYELEVTNGSTFDLWLLSTGPDSSSDSFLIALDGGTEVQISTGTGGIWEWKKLNGSLNIPSGRHTISIRVREDGARLDQLYLSNSSTAPTGLGSPTLPPQYR